MNDYCGICANLVTSTTVKVIEEEYDVTDQVLNMAVEESHGRARIEDGKLLFTFDEGDDSHVLFDSDWFTYTVHKKPL